MFVKPDFFDSFRCIASDCAHTCCAGWEIAVDPDKVALYDQLLDESEKRRLLPAPDGALLCREGGRCGFLRDNGLCDLIIRRGEDALCDICREHPRFYSYSENGNIREGGQGICCEAAAKLWLSGDVRLIYEDDGYEPESSELDELRAQSALMRDTEAMDVAIADCVRRYSELRGLFGSLETLEPLVFPEVPPAVSPLSHRLCSYYIYRWYFDYPDETMRFAAICAVMTSAMDGEFADAARRISCEVEYDPDNTDVILEYIRENFA